MTIETMLFSDDGFGIDFLEPFDFQADVSAFTGCDWGMAFTINRDGFSDLHIAGPEMNVPV
ncbi:MAG: hypothetical protein AAF926_00440, partial [Pseudomonadota bacterium]